MYNNFKELCEIAQEKQLALHQVILESEMALEDISQEQIYAKLEQHWDVMQRSATLALNQPQSMVGGLISGQSQKQQEYSAQGGYIGNTLNQLMAYALSSSEVNASMGRICAAPTAGACGILPAVLLTAGKQREASKQDILNALLVSSGIGAIITKNATVSGAEGGCQAECGTAAAMGAAAAVYLAGGTPAMIGQAISISLMNCMGLVCDPVAGLVQIPCSFRNASQSLNALLSADMALAGQQALIPADEAIEAMYRVGKQLPMELRETALGGIAQSPTACRLQKTFIL